MALDVQANWNICMAENLERTIKEANQNRPHTEPAVGRESKAEPVVAIDTTERPTSKRDPVHLPDELILQILDYTRIHASAQSTLASCALVSRQWYAATIPILYHAPRLYGQNFDPFVRTLCPSIIAHVRDSPLSSLVKILDMSGLVHQSSKSLTARLLGRTKGNLEEFRAPQASFAINCLPALSKCVRLRVLDLSLVSESPPLPELLRTTANLRNLQTMRLPRSSGFGVHHKPSSFASLASLWPQNLQDLTLSGGIDAHFLHGIVAFPSTLRSLTIEHCPNAKGFAVTHLLKTAVRPLAKLESLKIAHMPRLSSHALDDVLFLLPQINRLSVSVDYVTPALFDEGHFHHLKHSLPTFTAEGEEQQPSPSSPLVHKNIRTLELTNSGSPSGIEDKITPIDIMIAIDEGSIPNLRQVRVAKSLLWQSSSTREDVEALTEALQEGARRDWEGRVWVFEGGKEKRGWRDVAGVWAFEG
ncbi:hypothetical protein LTR37_012263 [Vermiconidia calcicola]|uniref:Uncharacterized protein n=1 Tax=Vermiconidia calcicola TaxID=1690605 RepID=A0ACC3N2P1_9PEZI|nr:hypothetical protein LTR37_012263 [Vermiconidia calcicola]